LEFVERTSRIEPVIKDALLRGSQHSGISLSTEALSIARLLDGIRDSEQVALHATTTLGIQVTANDVSKVVNNLSQYGLLVCHEVSEQIEAARYSLKRQGVHRHETLFGDSIAFTTRIDNAMDSAAALLSDGVQVRSVANPLGIAAPHANCDISLNVAAIAYTGLSPAPLPKVIVILAPNHVVALDPRAVVTGLGFQVPGGYIPTDTKLVTRLTTKYPGIFVRDDLLHEREHAIMMQLPFLIRVANPGAHIVPILIGYPRQPVHCWGVARRVGRILQRELAEIDAWWIVSGDLLHLWGRGCTIPATTVNSGEDMASLARRHDSVVLDFLAAGNLIAYYCACGQRNDCLLVPLIAAWFSAGVSRSVTLAYGQSNSVVSAGKGTTYASLALIGRSS